MALGAVLTAGGKVAEFRRTIEPQLQAARELDWADVVVGIPFCGEVDTLPQVAEIVRQGLSGYSPAKRCVVVAAGSPAGSEALKALKRSWRDDPGIRHLFFLLEDDFDGKGWAELAMLEIARELGSHLCILEADLIGPPKQESREGAHRGLRPEWIHLLLDPIERFGADLVLPRFTPEYTYSPISRHFVYPFMAAVYGWKLHEVMGGQLGLANSLIDALLGEPLGWSEHAGGYGIDVWLACNSVVNGARIFETCLGSKIHKASPVKRRFVFRQAAATLFHLAGRQSHFWEARHGILETPLSYVGGLGALQERCEEEEAKGARVIASLEFGRSLSRFKRGFSLYEDTLLRRILPEDLFLKLRDAATSPSAAYDFPAELWSRCVYQMLLAHTFLKGLSLEDAIGALCVLFDGRLVALANQDSPASEEVEVEAFLAAKSEFLARWRKEQEVRRPFLPRVAHWEFIPGVSIALPQEVERDHKAAANVLGIYEELVRERKAEFESSWSDLTSWLGADRKCPETSEEIAGRFEAFLSALERDMEILLPGDMARVESISENASTILNAFTREKAFVPDVAAVARALEHNPPRNLMTRLGCPSVNSLLARVGARDVLALADWTEHREYAAEVRGWMRGNLGRADFEESQIEVTAVKYEDVAALVETREVSALCRLAGRVVVSTLGRNLGGLFPRLRYFTTVAKNAVEAERVYESWRAYSRDRGRFVDKVINSIEGHRAEGVLSAHNLFENGNQRLLVERIRELAASIRRERSGDPAWLRLAEELELMARFYHLTVTLPTGEFIPCSAWTWASFSFKGGKGVPGPLSLHVERDWFVTELIMRIHERLGGRRADVDRKIEELAAQGREREDIASHLFGTGRPWVPQVLRSRRPPRTWDREAPPAGEMRRYESNPILFPVADHWWESKYVLNPAAIRLRGRVYLIYRAFGEDEVSRLGLAVSDDGFTISDRLPTPIFEPQLKEERAGCEDPRVAVIGDTMYMLYTAYDGVVPQIAVAAISVSDFLAGRWNKWERLGLAFPGLPNKDAVLYPCTFEGKYAMYHRIAPAMWVSYSDEMKCPWPREGHSILMSPRSGLMWDAIKIGAGSQPLKTTLGWLSIYHGVDYALVYRLGAMLTALDDPRDLIYRSPNPILEPVAPYERCGDPRTGIKSWVPNVVFTCGAVPAADVETLEPDDEILVYYGAGDSTICVATGAVRDLVHVPSPKAPG